METIGFDKYLKATEAGQLADSYWDTTLPQEMETSSASSPFFKVFLAAQVKAKDKGFLSRDITVTDLLLNRSDFHHIFPKQHLKELGYSKGRYNQIANFAVTQSEINIRIGDSAPTKYFAELKKQCEGETCKYGGIATEEELRENLAAHCIPKQILDSSAEKEPLTEDYERFIGERRKLMAKKLRAYYFGL